MHYSTTPNSPQSTFGIEIIHSQVEANQAPPDMSAREALADSMTCGDTQRQWDIQHAIQQVSQVVRVWQRTDDAEILDIQDIFTAEQLIAMDSRIQDYLGMDIDSHLETLSAPGGYPFYVGRLAMYFTSSDDEVTSRFSNFEDRHSSRDPKSRGPFEANSREYANFANQELLQQFEAFYQVKFNVDLIGPTKPVGGGRVSWERGIAECQFLVLDYIRDQLITGPRVSPVAGETMTLEDIGANLTTLLSNRRRLFEQTAAISPLLAADLDDAINGLNPFVVEEMHRGRMGTLRYVKEPVSARRAILAAESILLHAASLAESRHDQEDIPILDL